MDSGARTPQRIPEQLLMVGGAEGQCQHLLSKQTRKLSQSIQSPAPEADSC